MRLSQLHALLPELQALLTGARLQGLRQHGSRQFSLELYTGEKYRLWLDLSRPAPVCHLAAETPAAVEPGALAMALRGRLLNTRLDAITTLTQDRILRLDWQGEQTSSLILELSGRHANLFLLDEADKVLQQLYSDRSQRGLQRGSIWIAPEAGPAPTRPDPLNLAALPPDGSRSRALAEAYRQKLAANTRRGITGQGLAALTRKLDKARRELERLEMDLARLDESGLWQRRGELLQGAYGKIPKGAREARVIDYYDPNQAEATIPLDPALDLAANIQRCFKRARKLERGAERALELIEPASEKVAALSAELAELQTLAAQEAELRPDQLARFKALIPPPAPQRALPAAERAPYREFSSLSGRRILVGRSARDNDKLSFQIARGNDLWLHVRDWAGSHVLVPLGKNEAVDNETLLDAATLALHYSSAGSGSQAEVSYTRRKHVRRSKGAPAGQVHLSEFKTLSLRPEPERLARLLGKDLG